VACLRCDCECSVPLLDAPAEGNPLLRTSQKLVLSLSVSLSVSVFLRDFPIIVSNQRLLGNIGLIAIPALGVLLLLPCGLRPGPGFIRVYLMLYWGRPDWLWHLTIFLFSTCQIPLLPKAVTQEWRFLVTDSVPVPLSGSDLEAHLIINPSGVHPASRPCLPFPVLTGTLASQEKFMPWYLMTFLSYSHT
jgi:hypothetical protein